MPLAPSYFGLWSCSLGLVGFRVYGLWGLGPKVLGFSGFGVRGQGFGVYR